MPQKTKKPKKKQTDSWKVWKNWKRFVPRTRQALVLTAVITAGALTAGGFGLHPYAFANAPQLPEPTLKDLAAVHGIELGMLTPPDHLDREPFVELLTSQYSVVTTDGELHWDTFRPSPDEYDFDDVDKIVDFAARNGMPVQAHHLVWDEEDAQPEWLKRGDFSKQQLRDIMRTHIEAVVGRYKGRVAEWTVVNEPFSRAQGLYGLDDWWGSRFGDTSYIDDAFRWARQADPSATLILNDFANETATRVADAQYEYVKAAKARGVPIDAVGMQLHIDAAYPPDRAAMIRNMQRFAALGTPVYVTEFDINSSKVKGNAAYKAQLEARIAADAVRACIESKNCVSFTVFGMTDVAGIAKLYAYNKKRSYLFTSRYEPRPMFYGFRDAWLQR